MASDVLHVSKKLKDDLEALNADSILGMAVTPKMSVMYNAGDNIVCGSLKGEIHLIKNNCLFPYQSENNQALAQDQYCLAKTYPAHISFVNQCESTK